MKELIWCVGCEGWKEYYKMEDEDNNEVIECAECERIQR